MLLAGLDIGTTGCKTAVFKDSGEFLGKSYCGYPVLRNTSEHEIDPNDIWNAVKQVLKETAELFPDIGGIGVTSFGETFVMLDENDNPLMPSMLYTDPRGQEQCGLLAKRLGENKIIEITGLSASAMYSLPKIMWIRDNCPEIWNRVRHICLMEDYIVYLLTGKARIDYSLASRTMAFDINNLSWNSEILNAAGIDPGLFSEPVPIGTCAGNIKPEICRELGFNDNILVVSVGHDQAAAAVGSSVFDGSCSVDGAGTVECITPVFRKYDAFEMAKSGYAVIPYIIKGSFICYAFSFTGGALVDWFQKTLAGYAADEAKRSGQDIHTFLEKDWNDSPTGLLVLPHFAGAATPYMDSGSKGAIVGLTLGTTQQQLYLACLEGVCYEMRLNIERLNECGIKIKSLRAVGGGAKSDIWLQMKADILGIPVTRLGSEEAGAVGSAMLTGIAARVFRDLKQAADIMVSVKNTYFPRPEVHKAYEDPYQRYKCLYNAVRPLV